ncbi:TPA: hypothetical protein ACMD15_003629 [Vibrio cholerae]
MPRKKLKTNGSNLTSFSTEIVTRPHKFMDNVSYKAVLLTVTTSDGNTFTYEISADNRQPDLNVTKEYLNKTLSQAKRDSLNVEMTEYTERYYLFYEVQKYEQIQYSGERV